MGEYDEQPTQAQNYTGEANEINESLVKNILNPEELLINMEYDLKGYTLNTKEKPPVWEKQKDSKPLMNDAGIREIMNLVRIHVGKEITLSTYEPKQIEIQCKDIHGELANCFLLKYKEYEIDPKDRSMLIRKIMSPIYSSYQRAKNGLTINAITKATRETYTQADMQQKKGFLAGVSKWFG